MNDRDASVCAECLEDEDLREFVSKHEDFSTDTCSFCGDSGDSVVVCKFAELMQHMSLCIEQEYDLAANCLPWDGNEGGWQAAEYWDTPDLLRDKIGLELPRDHDDRLFGAMCSYLEYTDWCVKNPFGERPLDRLRFDWDEFTLIAKHQTRFFLPSYRAPRSRYELSERARPDGFLKAMGSAAQRLSVFSELECGAILFRVRYQADQIPLTTADQLGPPRLENAIVSNRMSPPGIVMFYCALDVETALAETYKESGAYALGRFRALRKLRLLDLTRLPDTPGFFAETPDTREWNRAEAIFFREFVEDLTKPIARDDRIHLEYVPTQIVVEYFRRQFHIDCNDRPPDGVIYPSSRRAGGMALVLFCDRSLVSGIDCPDELIEDIEGDPWIELVDATSVEVVQDRWQSAITPLL
jgi:hypothetical protein